MLSYKLAKAHIITSISYTKCGKKSSTQTLIFSSAIDSFAKLSYNVSNDKKEVLMDIRDREKLKRLEKTFELNFRLTRLYANYLEHYNEIINAEMMNALCGDGTIDEKDGFAAILCQIFGLDIDGSADERTLIRDYITPSVRVMDAERYVNNPYYKNIKIPEVKKGKWELKREKYPAYRGVIAADIAIYDNFREVPPLGFFKEEFDFPAVLEDGNEWMTLTPVDLDTSDEAIERAHGKVVTFGLGLGYYTYMVSEKEEVESITVVEKSEDVIYLFKEYILPQFTHPEKVRIVRADAFEYAEKVIPTERFNVAFVDTWRDASDGAPMYVKMKRLEHLSPDTEFIYWIENFLISRLRAIRFAEIEEKLENGEELSYGEILESLDSDNLWK